MTLISKNIFITILVILGLINRADAQSKQMTLEEFQKTFNSIIKNYEKLESSGIIIITQNSDNDSLYRFSRLESQQMLLKNKPTSYFTVNKKLVLYYGYAGLEKNISFDSTENDKILFKFLIDKSNRKLVDDLPKSKYVIVSNYDPIEWIVKVNKKGIAVYDKEATMKIKSSNPRWKI